MENKTVKLISLYIPALILLIYIAIRAYLLSFTHDESLSYTIIKGDPSWVFTANHHILNTRLMAFSSSIFGETEFALRLPNVFAFIVYALTCIAIVKKAKNIFLAITGLLLLLCNPLMLDFFSLARGYGLSLAFMMLSIYFLLQNIIDLKNHKNFNRNFLLSAAFGACSFLANLALINYFISAIAIHVLLYIFILYRNSTSRNFKIAFAVIFTAALIPLFFGIKRLLILSENEQLYFGESTFMHTIESLIWHSFYGNSASGNSIPVIKIIIFTSLFAGVLAIIFKRKIISALSLILLLLLMIFAGLQAEHYLFNSKFPIERTALFFIPLYMLFLYFLFYHFAEFYRKSKIAVYIFSTVICAALVYNVGRSVNFWKSYVWTYDAFTKDAMLTINEKIKNRQPNVQLSNHWLFEPAINYYISSRNMKLNRANRDGVKMDSDFIFRMNDTSEMNNFIILKNYPKIDANLLMRKDFNSENH